MPKVSSAVISRFAKGDAEGWHPVNEDDSGRATEFMRVDSDGRNFWLHAKDVGNGKYFGWLSPSKFNGNQSDKFGRFLNFRVRTDGNGRALPDTAWYVRVRGRGRVMFVDQATVGRLESNRWQTYRIKLDSSGGWKMRNDSGQSVVALDQDIEFVLGNVKDIWIRGEYRYGVDTGLLDDVEFGAELTSEATQINSTHKDPHKTGSLYRIPLPPIHVSPSPVPPDTWFTLEAEAAGARIRVWVNEKLTVDWLDPGSTYKRGHIAIQAHHPGSHVQIRKLDVLELDRRGLPQ
jgi:hypothetical protein